MRVGAVLAALVVATIATVVVLGSEEKPRLAGTNGVDPAVFAIELRGGERHCQRNEFVPADSDRLEMTIGSYNRPLPAIDIAISGANGRRVVRHTVPAGGREGVVKLPLGRTVDQPVQRATVCIGSRSRVALAGYNNSARLAWYRPGEESMWSLAPTVAHRFGIGKAGWMGTWTAVLWVALIGGVWSLAARLVLRETRA